MEMIRLVIWGRALTVLFITDERASRSSSAPLGGLLVVFGWPCGVSKWRLRRLGMYLGRLVWSREDALDGLWRLGEAWTRHGGSGWRLVRDVGSFVGGLRAFGGRFGASRSPRGGG